MSELNEKLATAWEGFTKGDWQNEVNVRDFIQKNYTPYEGDESFLAGATEATTTLWDKVMEGVKLENRTHAPVDFDTAVASTITSHDAGYINKQLEKIVGLQTEAPLKRALIPFGGIKMIEGSCKAYNRELDPMIKKIFTEYRKTHNQGVYACRIIVPGMSDIYPAEDLWLANNSMGSHLRETILSLPGSEWEKEDYLNLIEQLDEEGFDDFTRVRELLGLATGSDNGWYTLRIGELKAMLALAGGDLEQALVWTEWTMEFNSSVFSPERANYYRCLQTLLLLAQEEDRQPLQYLNAFVRMYGADAVEAASAAMSGEAAFYGLQPVDSDLHAFAAHQSLLKAYEKLQRAKAAFWAK
jgi:hypothetical protein